MVLIHFHGIIKFQKNVTSTFPFGYKNKNNLVRRYFVMMVRSIVIK